MCYYGKQTDLGLGDRLVEVPPKHQQCMCRYIAVKHILVCLLHRTHTHLYTLCTHIHTVYSRYMVAGYPTGMVRQCRVHLSSILSLCLCDCVCLCLPVLTASSHYVMWARHLRTAHNEPQTGTRALTQHTTHTHGQRAALPESQRQKPVSLPICTDSYGAWPYIHHTQALPLPAILLPPRD